jgi:hypothetical protein
LAVRLHLLPLLRVSVFTKIFFLEKISDQQTEKNHRNPKHNRQHVIIKGQSKNLHLKFLPMTRLTKSSVINTNIKLYTRVKMIRHKMTGHLDDARAYFI